MSRKVRTFFLNKLKKKQSNLTLFLRVQDKKEPKFKTEHTQMANFSYNVF